MKENYCSPVVGRYRITSLFGYRIHPIEKKKKYHAGVDISNQRSGDPIYAIDDGVVVSVSRSKYQYGKWTAESIKLKHNDPDVGYSFYTHLYQGSTNHLAVGDSVFAGDEIGKLGNTGGSTGAHLHFEIKNGADEHIDPYQVCFQTSTEIIAGKSNRQSDGTISIQQVEVRDGVYYAVENDQLISQPPEPLPFYSNPPDNETGQFYDKPEEKEEEGDGDKASIEDIRASLIGYYMPEIIKEKQIKESPKNIIFLNGAENTAALSNIVLSKTKNDFSKITNLELANMVPFIELYSLKASGQAVEEILYPFDDYTAKTKIESIFYDKTGRGGNIGIKSLDWEILATNPSNRSQISAKLKIYIQDIQEIEAIRNGISLIDFLYPTGTRDNTFSAHNFNVKMKVGWLYKRQGNDTLNDLDKKIAEKDLQEVMHLCLAKHVFEFMEDGSVELTLDYFGMIESQISNPNSTNILDKLNPVSKPKERVIKWWKQILDIFEQEDSQKYLLRNMEQLNSDPAFKRFGIKIYKKTARNDFFDVNLSSLVQRVGQLVQFDAWGETFEEIGTGEAFYVDFSNVQSEISYQEEFGSAWAALKEIFEDAGTATVWLSNSNIKKLVEIAKKEVTNAEKELVRSYKSGLSNLLGSLEKDKNIMYLKIPGKVVEQLRNYSIADNVFSSDDLQEFVTLKSMSDSSVNASLNLTSSINEAINIKEEAGFGSSKFVFDEKEFRKTIEKQYETQTKTENTGDIVVAYTHLDFVLSYYLDLFYEKSDIKEIKDLRIVLGSFSYRDLGNFDFEKNREGAGARNSSSIIVKNGKYVEKLEFAKKYANLGDIPISIESLIKWYNANVLDADLSKMSFHAFIKSLINDIIPINITNNILPFVPSRSIPISINYVTTPEIKSLEEELEKLSNNPNKKYYTINMSKEQYKNTGFYHFKNKQLETAKDEKKQNINYMFLFSSLERDDFLTGDYSKDLDKNIYHFYIGEETGLIKKLKFTREDNRQLDAANIIKANNGDSDTAIMRQIYNLDLEMFGNTIFQPGQLLHVVPTYPGARLKNKLLFDIGLGGYYQITKMSSYIDDNDFKTSIKGHWQFSGLDSERDRDQASVYRTLALEEVEDEL